MTDDELTGYLALAAEGAEGAERAERATAGPWEADQWLKILRVVVERDAQDSANPGQFVSMLMNWPCEQFVRDAAHIADARARVPALAAAVAALAAEVRRLRHDAYVESLEHRPADIARAEAAEAERDRLAASNADWLAAATALAAAHTGRTCHEAMARIEALQKKGGDV